MDRLWALVGEWLERLARWRAQGYLNQALATRINDKKNRKYSWELRGKSATWRKLMYGNNLEEIVACTVVLAYGKRVAVGASFHIGELVDPQCFPPRSTLTEVLPYIGYSPEYFRRDPVLFYSPQEFKVAVKNLGIPT